MWNLLCQYNNIYTGLHKYLKEKKKAQTDYRKTKKKTIAIVAVQNLGGKKVAHETKAL